MNQTSASCRVVLEVDQATETRNLLKTNRVNTNLYTYMNLCTVFWWCLFLGLRDTKMGEWLRPPGYCWYLVWVRSVLCMFICSAPELCVCNWEQIKILTSIISEKGVPSCSGFVSVNEIRFQLSTSGDNCQVSLRVWPGLKKQMESYQQSFSSLSQNNEDLILLSLITPYSPKYQNPSNAIDEYSLRA